MQITGFCDAEFNRYADGRFTGGHRLCLLPAELKINGLQDVLKYAIFKRLAKINKSPPTLLPAPSLSRSISALEILCGFDSYAYWLE